MARNDVDQQHRGQKFEEIGEVQGDPEADSGVAPHQLPGQVGPREEEKGAVAEEEIACRGPVCPGARQHLEDAQQAQHQSAEADGQIQDDKRRGHAPAPSRKKRNTPTRRPAGASDRGNCP